MSGTGRRWLHVVASPRGASVSTAVASAFLAALREAEPGARVETLDLWQHPLPEMRDDVLSAKYAVLAKRPHAGAEAAAWTAVRAEAERLRDAEGVLVSTPMWNFSIPYRLKHWIDTVTQPGITFDWSRDRGYSGRLAGRRAVVVCASSFDYRAPGPLARLDHQKGYLEGWLRFLGIDDVATIDAGPTHPADPGAAAARASACAAAEQAARRPWSLPNTEAVG